MRSLKTYSGDSRKICSFERTIENGEGGIVSRQELSMPPTTTVDQIKGFSLFMIKAILDGRGNEIIDLAKTNLLR